MLAAAIAFADNAIADEENETLNSLAEGLGIDEAKADGAARRGRGRPRGERDELRAGPSDETDEARTEGRLG